MATSALVDINSIVTDYLLGYKKTTEDSFTYLKHACDCVRSFHLFDSPNVVSEKVTISALGIIEMPEDMLGFNGLFKPLDGELWAFTRKDTIVNTTTFTGSTEGQDSDFGEGVGITDPKSDDYGGVGGVNDYYYTIDWKARRIFCEGITSETVLLRYTTSGVEVSGTTYVPSFVIPMIEAYLKWKEAYWTGEERFAEARERTYIREEMKVRNLVNSMTYDEWRDLLLSQTTMTPIR